MSALPRITTHPTGAHALAPVLYCAALCQPSVLRMWANSCRASRNAHFLAGAPLGICASKQADNPRSCIPDGSSAQLSSSGLRSPMALRTMRFTAASTPLLVVPFQRHPQLQEADIAETWRHHHSHRVPRDNRLEVRQAPWAENAGPTFAMRRSYSGGPLVTTLSPSTIRSSSARRSAASGRGARSSAGASSSQQFGAHAAVESQRSPVPSLLLLIIPPPV